MRDVTEEGQIITMSVESQTRMASSQQYLLERECVCVRETRESVQERDSE